MCTLVSSDSNSEQGETARLSVSSAGPQGTHSAHFSSEHLQKPQKMFFTTAYIPAHQVTFQQSALLCPVITPSRGNRFPTFPDTREKCQVEHHRSCLSVSTIGGQPWCLTGAVSYLLPDLSSTSLLPNDLELLC